MGLGRKVQRCFLTTHFQKWGFGWSFGWHFARKVDEEFSAKQFATVFLSQTLPFIHTSQFDSKVTRFSMPWSSQDSGILQIFNKTMLTKYIDCILYMFFVCWESLDCIAGFAPQLHRRSIMASSSSHLVLLIWLQIQAKFYTFIYYIYIYV